MPDESIPQSAPPESAASAAPPYAPQAGPKWFQRLSSVLFVIFCFELGLFLLIYPWTDAWSDNYFSVAVPDTALSAWRAWWNNPYLRGAVTGLGVVNIWVAVAEALRLFIGGSD